MVFNVEASLTSALQAAREAHEGGYVNGMEEVTEHIEEALEALQNVTWGDNMFPEIDEDLL
jgi:hypothetical protein